MPTEQAANSVFFSNLIPMLLVCLVFYFVLIKPEKQKKKDKESMRDSIKKSDKIVTAGGIHGTVVMVKDKTVILRLDDNVRVEFDKEAISTITKAKNKTES
ncbi:MAG: preprotein translocase subunit YajC [Candidatus Omnitrophica bacterium]|nr:preprotein translocase subunit YajC [Candidatus Omnitrophota bacterium]